ncbi:MAG: UvrD-helicase domain-containing protein, partial [Candidatus Omnitrophica bacterium]|nr:UvrD-helicase domain-containing protein [Candidatus Omnitrophota bacterium]
ALENGIPFETEVVDDRPLYESCLYDLLRKGWPEKYRDGFESLLRMSGFEGSLSDRKNWRDQIQQIAMKWQPEVGDRLIPEPPEDLGDFVKNFQSVFESQVTTLRECVGTVDESDLEQHPIHVGFSKLKVHGSTKKSILTKMLPPLFRFVAKSKQGQVSWSDFMDLAEESRGYTKFKDTQSFEVLLPIPGDAIESACPGLPRAVAALESLRKLAPGKRVFAGFIRDLREEVDRTKSDRGQISFNDMILHLYSALQPENPASERFLTELRNRFRYGLVDEFQDTDAAQWGIFRRIFLESKKGNRLFLIGDPKQSIYRFRGADVQTYLEAKEEILNSPEGAGYTLDTNWRSTPELIEGFNRLFSKDNGWFRPESKIEHRDCAAPPEDLRKSFLLEDPTGTRAINLIQMTEGIGLRNAKYRIYHWIAGEIRRLMENRERFRIQSGDKERGLRCDDICVLVRARSEAEAFQEILGEDIPSTFYKKAGLYESREAAHLSVLLHALLEPDSRHLRKALLTDFFRVPAETIGEMTRTDAPIPYHSMFDRWREWAVDRNWPALFHSILSETQVLYERDDAGDLHPTSERSWTNYSHLAQNLETEANVHQWDLSDLVFTLDRYRHRTIEIDADTDLHRLESETPKVQIMTLHVSKGLQF